MLWPLLARDAIAVSAGIGRKISATSTTATRRSQRASDDLTDGLHHAYSGASGRIGSRRSCG